MSNMSELATIKAELLSCGQVLVSIAENLREIAHTWDDAPQQETVPEAPPLTLADVRAVLAQKSVEGHTCKVQELIRKYGSDKLSQVDAKHYSAMLAEAEEW